jgi:hypothetical protein
MADGFSRIGSTCEHLVLGVVKNAVHVGIEENFDSCGWFTTKMFPRILAIQWDCLGFNRNPMLFPMNERSCPVFRPKKYDPRLRSTSQSKTVGNKMI